jgi:hypothetical protein
MELNDLRRVSSAGYRLPDPPIGGIPNATKHLGLVRKAPKNNSKEDGPSVEYPSKSDPLIQNACFTDCSDLDVWENVFSRSVVQQGSMTSAERLLAPGKVCFSSLFWFC